MPTPRPKKQRLDLLLVEQDLVESREQGRRLIMAGEVLVDEVVVDKPGTKGLGGGHDSGAHGVEVCQPGRIEVGGGPGGFCLGCDQSRGRGRGGQHRRLHGLSVATGRGPGLRRGCGLRSTGLETALG